MKKLSVFFAAALLVAACAPKEEINVLPGSKVFNATIDGTRTYVDGRSVLWSEGDAISVFNKNTYNAEYDIVSGAGTKGATFAEAGEAGEGTELSLIYAVAPYDQYNAIDEDGVIFTYFSPAGFYMPDSYPDGSNVMVAVEEEGNTLNFKNVSGYLNIRLLGDCEVQVVQITSTDQSLIAGEAYVKANLDGTFEVTLDSESEFAYNWANVYSDSDNNEFIQLDPKTPTDFWIPLPPQTLNGFDLVVVSKDQKYFEASMSKTIEIKSGVLSSTEPLVVTFEDTPDEVQGAVYVYDLADVYGADFCAQYGYDNTNSFAYVVAGNDIVSGTCSVWATSVVNQYGLELVAQYSEAISDDQISAIAQNGYYIDGVAGLGDNTSYTVVAQLTNSSGSTAIFSAEYVTEAKPEIPFVETTVEAPYLWDFEEDEDITGWRFIDSDGDGNKWSMTTGLIAYSGEGLLYSQSYDNNSGALTPDNWAITPGVILSSGNYLSFWVCGQDPDWDAEHYAVYITDATPGETIVMSDWELVFEETLGDNEGHEEKVVTVENSDGSTKEVTLRHFVFAIDSKYDTKTIHVGFRHYNCTDNFYLNLDDVAITDGNPLDAQSAPSSMRSRKVPANKQFKTLKSLDLNRR